jgi:hypothetical protein
MAADGVVSFVTANVPSAKAGAVATYEQERLASAGLTEPGGGGASRTAKADLNPTSIYAARSAAVKGA